MTVPTLPTLHPAMAFDEAAGAVLDYLRERMPWGFWSVSRISDGAQVHLHVDDVAVGVSAGRRVPLEATVCVRMLAGEGPHIAPDIAAVPAYADAPVVKELGLVAYAGLPITEADGGLFGVLCGLSTHPVDEAATDEPLLELLAGLLGMVLAADRQREQLARAVEDAHVAAHTDPLTGLHNRRGWDRLLEAETAVLAKFGDPAAVALVDLDDLKAVNDTEGHAAGDARLVLAARVLRDAVGEDHTVARLGGDEFGVLLRRTDVATAREVVAALDEALHAAAVPGSIGMAPHTAIGGFVEALSAADRAMYEVKRGRQRGRTTAA